MSDSTNPKEKNVSSITPPAPRFGASKEARRHFVEITVADGPPCGGPLHADWPEFVVEKMLPAWEEIMARPLSPNGDETDLLLSWASEEVALHAQWADLVQVDIESNDGEDSDDLA